MSHDTEAAFAASEISKYIMNNTEGFFGEMGAEGSWSVYSGRESGRPIWPLADAVIHVENSKFDKNIYFALEFKRPNEGVHGILTALGQSVAYIEKGYDASVIVIPESYSSKEDPGDHVKRMIETIAPNSPIIIFTYSPPDLTATEPFNGKLKFVRGICLPECETLTSSEKPSLGKPHTLWAHMREGMSYPDAFYKYCQSVKIVSTLRGRPRFNIQKELIQAILSIKDKSSLTQEEIQGYLAYTSGSEVSDMAWQHFWFTNCFNEIIMPIFSKPSNYIVNKVKTKIMKSESDYMELWSARKDSIKSKLVDQLNSGTIDEGQAWIEYAKDVHSKAHSYRK